MVDVFWTNHAHVENAGAVISGGSWIEVGTIRIGASIDEARAIVASSIGIIVGGLSIHATGNSGASAITANISDQARTIVALCKRGVVAGEFIHTSREYTSTVVAICLRCVIAGHFICTARKCSATTTFTASIRIDTSTVIFLCRGVIIASRRIRAPAGSGANWFSKNAEKAIPPAGVVHIVVQVNL